MSAVPVLSLSPIVTTCWNYIRILVIITGAGRVQQARRLAARDRNTPNAIQGIKENMWTLVKSLMFSVIDNRNIFMLLLKSRNGLLYFQTMAQGSFR